MRALLIALATALAVLAATQPADSQSKMLLLGVTSAPPACITALNFSQTCNSVNLDLL